jgi:hypothetical protein
LKPDQAILKGDETNALSHVSKEADQSRTRSRRSQPQKEMIESVIEGTRGNHDASFHSTQKLPLDKRKKASFQERMKKRKSKKETISGKSTLSRIEIGCQRILFYYEKKRKVKRERSLVNRKSFRRKEEGRKEERKIRRNSTKNRRKRNEHVEVTHLNLGIAVVLIGSINVEKRRVNRLKKERTEEGLNHMQVIKEREARCTIHRTLSSNGCQKAGIGTKSEGGYYGYRFQIKGTIDGSRRSLKYEIKAGVIPNGTKRARVTYAEGVAKTSVGSVGLRVEYCYSLG